VRARLLELGVPWLITDAAKTINEFFDRDLSKELPVIEESIMSYLRAARHLGESPRQVGESWRGREGVNLNVPAELSAEIGGIGHHVSEDEYWTLLEDVHLQLKQTARLVEELEKFIRTARDVHYSFWS
jgi:hypothetical protein